MKNIIVVLMALSLVWTALPALALPPARTAMELSTPGVSRELLLPAAADGSPVISLGQAVDPKTGKIVDGIAFIHYKTGYEKGSNSGKKPGGGASSCYAFLANGARWKTTEGYVVDPTNTRGLDGTTVSSLLAQAAETWDGQVIFNVFNPEVTGVVDGADNAAPDGKNEFLFADVSGQGAIAVTIVWGVFSGPTFNRELVEWDMVFDDVDFDWSAEAAGVAGKMDFLNIATHEIGHAAGLGHPANTCTEETMYAYANYGETMKRNLNAGDIAGIKALYK